MKQFKAKSEGALQIAERHNFQRISTQGINKSLSALEVSEEQGNTSKNVFQRLAVQFRRAIIHKDPITLYRAAKAIRIKISTDSNPPLDDFLETGLNSDIVKLLDPDDKVNVDLQFEFIWIISNACIGDEEQTSTIVTRHLIETILRFIWHPEKEIVKQAFWLIGNISGNSDAERNSLIQLDALSTISKFTKRNKKSFPAEFLRLGSWIFNNISANYNSHEQFFKYDDLLGLIQNMLELDDNEICSNACWTYSRLIETGDKNCIAAIVTPKFLDRIVQLLEDKDPAILISVIQTVQNILSSVFPNSLKKMHAVGCLDKLEALIDHIVSIIRSEAIQVISNLVTEPNLLAEILQRPLFSKLLHIIHIDLTSVQREAIVCLKNALRIANRQQVESLVKLGLIRSFPKILSSGSLQFIMTGLEAIEIILRHGLEADEPANPYIIVLENEGVVAYLEELQYHHDQDVHRAVVRIFETYFEAE